MIGNMTKQLFSMLLCHLLLIVPVDASAEGQQNKNKIKPKVVIVSPWEFGEVSGDRAGEYQRWVEREKLTTVIDFPVAANDLHMNSDGLLAVNTGAGVSNSAMVIMAFGLDERFDLSESYWIIGGIAGGDPADVTIGSAAWARWVVDGDLMRAIDSREIPDSWPYGFFPSDGVKPNDRSDGFPFPNQSFELNRGLVQWAYKLSQDVELMDHPEVIAARAKYVGFPNAQRPPAVVLGESLGSNIYWSGKVLTQWANDWVRLYTGGEGNFVMTNVEDNGTLRALTRLDDSGLVDRDRVLVLRTASNFSHQPDGMEAVDSLTADYPAEGETALENIHRVAAPVAHELISGWDSYAKTIPIR
jgi:purine nucleoside permease